MTTITTSFYLDQRSLLANGEAPLKISVTKKGSTAYIPLGITLLPKQWDNTRKKIIGHPRRSFLNSFIIQKKLDIDEVALAMVKKGGFARLSVTQIKNKIVLALKEDETPVETFASRLARYVGQLDNPRTRAIYQATETRMKEFAKNYSKLTFEDITIDWLNEFDKHLAKTSPARNARNIHFRNIRAIFNDAKRARVTTEYPFGRGLFEIRPEKTRKRSFSVDVMRGLFSRKLEPWQEKYRDMFKLIFLLIGINFVDLCRLESIEDGRVNYRRAKTKRLYSVKVEPEALELINKYRGQTHLLSLIDGGRNYRVAYMSFVRGLNHVRESLGLEELTSYWARHTWATIASSLGIQRDTIAHALGHGSDSVTDIYIDFDQSLVDDANRKVLDWVLYGKK